MAERAGFENRCTSGYRGFESRPLRSCRFALGLFEFVSGRGVRVAEGARLETVCAATYRGFESRPLRHFIANQSLQLPGPF